MATRYINTVIPRVQPTRSTITVAGIVGTSLSGVGRSIKLGAQNVEDFIIEMAIGE